MLQYGSVYSDIRVDRYLSFSVVDRDQYYRERSYIDAIHDHSMISGSFITFHSDHFSSGVIELMNSQVGAGVFEGTLKDSIERLKCTLDFKHQFALADGTYQSVRVFHNIFNLKSGFINNSPKYIAYSIIFNHFLRGPILYFLISSFLKRFIQKEKRSPDVELSISSFSL